ncbi:aminotransferase class I/II-fold pyridoxal phosphate-dependent enzyme [Cryobacterium breve]|uniref:Aminotransferase class I/II-fold pyridoxal phosphate-dependent enzyme n=1 Tax=Cryobacterium breve TaxID=1259258 RepID=A0ABY7NIQ4_9MICO|nr:aminotransferase class I/II-fold pyridoxal phosphate-dependent enzyme [Cryobacterium breve]
MYLTAGFVFDDFDDARNRFAGVDPGYIYSRYANPTVAAVEQRIAALEHGADAILVGSGQAAISSALLGLLRAGDHVVSASSIYEGSRALFLENFPALDIESTFVEDANDPAEWERRIRPNTRALFAESISNPRNRILDVAAIADVARRHGIPLVIDNTFASPYLLRPIEHGADIVVHSASKFLSGHGTVLGGVIVDGGRFDWGAHPDRFSQLTHPGIDGGPGFLERFGRTAYSAYTRSVIVSRLGPTASPFTAFLIQQGIETLSLRLDRQSATALALARWLEGRPEVSSVDYAGLASHPHYELARRYLPRGQGSVFAVTLRGGVAAAKALINAVGLFTHMAHLGDVRSLIQHPASTSHAHRTDAQLRYEGIGPGMIRLSVGVEDAADLIADLERGLAAIPRSFDIEAAFSGTNSPPDGAVAAGLSAGPLVTVSTRTTER